MERLTETLLRVGLIVAAIGSLLSLARMILATFLPVDYYWWGAIGFFSATALLSAAIYIHTASRRVPGPA